MPKKSYLPENLLAAVAAVKNGCTFSKAVKDYSVPYSTLHDKLNERYKKVRKGPNTTLTYDQEACLAKHLIYMAKIGYGFAKKDVPQLVKEQMERINENRLKTGQKLFEGVGEDCKPSMSWVYKFLRRWPELSTRIPESFGYRSNDLTESKIGSWCDAFQAFMQSEHHIDARSFFVQENSSRIFYCDKSIFPSAGTGNELKVVIRKDKGSVHKMTPSSKEQVTLRINLLSRLILCLGL